MASKESNTSLLKATFGMQCFWGADGLFPSFSGVIRTRVGYCGGTKANPTYRSLGDHTEAIDIDFDPKLITFDELLSKFFENHDPTQKHKTQYMSAIFYHNEEQKNRAEESIKEQQKKYSRPIVTVLKPVGTFYDAEDYHQKYQLRQHSSLFKSLKLDGKALIKSHVAAKLNAYVSGYVAVEQIEKEAKELGLTDDQKSEVIRIIKAGVTRHC